MNIRTETAYSTLAFVYKYLAQKPDIRCFCYNHIEEG